MWHRMSGKKTHGDPREVIKPTSHVEGLHDYICNTHFWTRKILKSVDWEGCQLYMGEIYNVYQTYVIKMVHK